MHVWTKLVLALGVVVAGYPHAFCDCGCASAARQQAVRSCPHCDRGQDDGRGATAPQRPRPCECRQCELSKAVLADSPAAVPSLDPSERVSPAPVAVQTEVVLAGPAEDSGRAKRPASPLFYPCALPILLEHLLL